MIRYGEKVVEKSNSKQLTSKPNKVEDNGKLLPWQHILPSSKK